MLLPVDRAPRRPGASLHLCQATGSVNILGQTLQLPGVQHMRRLPCLRADREALCDLLVRMTAGEQPQHLRRTSELHDTRRKADLVTAQMERLPLAVPLLVACPIASETRASKPTRSANCAPSVECVVRNVSICLKPAPGKLASRLARSTCRRSKPLRAPQRWHRGDRLAAARLPWAACNARSAGPTQDRPRRTALPSAQPAGRSTLPSVPPLSEPCARVPDVNQQVEFDITQGYRLKTCEESLASAVIHPTFGIWRLSSRTDGGGSRRHRALPVGSDGLRMCPSSRRNRIDRAVAFR